LTAHLSGYLSNMRVLKGSGYTSVTVPTAPLTAITNTSLLTCQSNRFIDNSSNAFALTATGTPSVQAFSPFAPTAAYSAATNGASGYFDATGDYLSISDASNLASPGSGDFTAETWLYVPALPSNALGASAVYHLKNDTGTSTTVFIIEITSGGALNLSNGTALISGGTSGRIKAGAWNHLVVSRLSGTLRSFINGTQDISVANTTTYNGSVVQIGAWRYSTSDFSINGYIGGFRFQKGTGYSSVTVPTSPFTAITNTSLLLNFTNGGIVDATGKNVLETVGNAQISTTQSKFGGSSMYFDGTANTYLVQNPATSDLYAFGSGDFTIECWLYLISTTSIRTLYDSRASGTTSSATPTIYIDAGTIKYYVSGADRITGSALSTGQWYHIALARSGTSTKMFINGTQAGSTYTDSTVYINSSRRPFIGGDSNSAGSNLLGGYIDDLRITKGYARYTASFTPPTAAFATQ
jgi:hypothetical protein